MYTAPFSWVGDLGDWSELALPSDDWQYQFQRYLRYYRYYSGIHLTQKIPNPEGGEDIELYPVKMNLVKLLTHSQADALWGEWDDRVVSFDVEAPSEASEQDRKSADAYRTYLHGVFEDNFMDKKLWEVGLDMMRYGGGLIRIMPDVKRLHHIRLERVPVTSFYPIWNPDDPDDLLEAYLVYELNKNVARARYGIRGEKDTVIRVEHWTKTTYTNTVDGKRVDQFSGKNPWGVIPLVYFPRQRSDLYYGEALTEDIMSAQDELNARVADLGEAITYNSHPIKYGSNLPPDIDDRTKFPFTPDALWDLGRTLPGNESPKLDVLATPNPVPERANDYIDFVYDWTRTAAYSPPIAFGEDEGSQRSGATLTIRMWPLTRSIRRSRLYLRAGLQQTVTIIMAISKTNFRASTDAAVLRAAEQCTVVPRFAPVLPRERTEIVNEVVQRMSTDPQTLSMEGALEMLGERDIAREAERIKAQMKEKQERAQTALEQRMDNKEDKEREPDEDRVAD